MEPTRQRPRSAFSKAMLRGILLSIALVGPAAAQPNYRYALVVAPTLSVDGFGPGSFNDSGEVVYADDVDDVIATSSATIARASDTIDGELFAAVAAGGGTAIDDEGHVAFRARYGDGDFDAIFTATSVIAKQWDNLTGVTLGFVGPPDIGAGGQVVYEATVCPAIPCSGSAIYLDRAELLRTPVSDGFVELSGVSDPVIDDSGQIAHYGYAFLADVSGVYHLTGASTLSRIVHTGESVGAGLVLDNPRGLLQGLDINAQGDIATTWTTEAGEWLVLKNDTLVARAGDVIDGTVLTEVQSHAPAINDAGTVAFLARHAGGFAVFTPDALVLQEGRVIGGETIAFLEGVAINDSGTIAIHVGFESGLDGIVLAVPDTNRRLRMTTGSSVAVRQTVDLPTDPFALRFDYRFATTTGTLAVRLAGMPLGSVSATAVVGDELQRSVFSVDGALLGQSGVVLELELDGETGSTVDADNVFLPGLQNGSFESGDLSGWEPVVSGGGSVTVVPEPGSLAGAVAGLLVLAVLRIRRHRRAGDVANRCGGMRRQPERPGRRVLRSAVAGAAAACLVVAIAVPSRAQQDRHVSTTGRDAAVTGIPNDCTNLGFAPCRTIGHALEQADDGDVVKVATGVYFENITFSGASPRPIGVEGGWGLDFAARDDDPAAHTTIKGNGAAPVFDLVAEAIPVIFTIDGFTIENGGGSSGGAIRAVARNEEGRTAGGSLELRVANCRLQNNLADQGGAIALYTEESGPGQSDNFLFAEISDSQVRHNAAIGQLDRGGGLYGLNEAGRMIVHLFDDEFVGNASGGNGAGVALSAIEAGAETTLQMARNQFYSNQTQYETGVYLSAVNDAAFDADFENNIIAGAGRLEASATSGGHLDLTLLNDTITYHRIGLYLLANFGTISARGTNVIVNDNTFVDVFLNEAGQPGSTVDLRLAYSNVGFVDQSGGTYTPSNNFDEPTQFVSPGTRDYHLLPTAAELDAGTCGFFVEMPPIPPQYFRTAPLDDFEGDLRQPFPQAITGCDVGADEYTSGVVPPSVDLVADPTHIEPGGSSQLLWVSQNATTCSLQTCLEASPFCSVSTVETSGEQQVSPVANTLYRVECQSLAGSGEDTVTVFVPEPESPLLMATALGVLASLAARRPRAGNPHQRIRGSYVGRF